MAKGGATEQHEESQRILGLWSSLRRNRGRGGSNDRDTGEFQRWNPSGLSQKYGNQEPIAVRTPKGGLSPSRPVSSFPRSIFVSFSLVSPSAYVDPSLGLPLSSYLCTCIIILSPTVFSASVHACGAEGGRYEWTYPMALEAVAQLHLRTDQILEHRIRYSRPSDS